MNYIDFFDHGATLYPQRTCLTDGELSLNYRDTQAYTHRIALALQARKYWRGQ